MRKLFPDENDAFIRIHGYEIVKRYFRNIALPYCVNKTYNDSFNEGFFSSAANGKTKKERDDIKLVYDDRFHTGKDTNSSPLAGSIIDGFLITQEIIDMFGEGYSPNQYKKMYDKYENLKQNYMIQTSLHQEALITYVRFKVQEEIATSEGKVDEAKKWYDAAQNAADKAKLSPKQLTKADLQKGLNSFSEISQALEQAVDIIETLPRYKSQPNDSVDFNIWCYINYARKLKGLPTVSYEDVYHFYDDMKSEYIHQYGDPYGIFADDMTEKNRENIDKFITLPSDYDEVEDDESEGEIHE